MHNLTGCCGMSLPAGGISEEISGTDEITQLTGRSFTKQVNYNPNSHQLTHFICYIVTMFWLPHLPYEAPMCIRNSLKIYSKKTNLLYNVKEKPFTYRTSFYLRSCTVFFICYILPAFFLNPDLYIYINKPSYLPMHSCQCLPFFWSLFFILDTSYLIYSRFS